MKKRILALLVAVCLGVSMLVLPASAASLNNTAIQTAVTLGAMEPGQTGSLNAAVTRGALAKMLVAFSAYRESATKQGSLGTLYKDVPGTSQWAPYVRIAVQQGWMNGYTDGTFRPDNAVTLEEAATAVLKLLGYKMTDLNGAFPQAQLNKAQEIGLRSQLSRALFVLQQAQPVLGQLAHAGNQFFQLGFAVLGQAGPPGFDSGVQLVPDVIGQFGGELTRPIDSILQSRLHGGRVGSISHGGDIRPGLLQALLLFFRQGVCGDFIDGRQQIVGLGADGIHLLLGKGTVRFLGCTNDGKGFLQGLNRVDSQWGRHTRSSFIFDRWVSCFYFRVLLYRQA